MRRILIIEDVELNRDLLVQLLEDEYELVTANDGRAGIEAAKREHPDLILTDLQLPVVDGWEATRRIKADPELRGIPVIAISSHVMPADKQAALDSGCDAYLSKPLDESELFALLGEFLGDASEDDQ